MVRDREWGYRCGSQTAMQLLRTTSIPDSSQEIPILVA